jgi:hypothetical protein
MTAFLKSPTMRGSYDFGWSTDIGKVTRIRLFELHAESGSHLL